MQVSGRNQLQGKVTAVERDGLLAQVTLEVSGGRVTAIITRDAADELGLVPGAEASALIKATSVMIVR